jgi:hypothetical protein
MTLTLSAEIEGQNGLPPDPAEPTGSRQDGIVSPRRVLTRRLLSDAVAEALSDCTNKRCEVSGVAARIVARLGRDLAGARRDVVLYGSPKKKETRDALSRWGVDYKPGEFLSDYTLGHNRGTIFELLIACESEVHPSHGVGSTYQTHPTGEPRNGYIWDLRKLLHCPAPNLLFVAWLSDRKFALLRESIEHAARDYFRVWRDKALGIVLVPTASTRRGQTLIGLSRDGMEPRFAPIGAAADVGLTGTEYQNEWNRLRDAGEPRTGPAFEDLLRRLSERNDYIIEAYAKPLRRRYPGCWASIDATGRYLLAESREVARRRSEEAFGFAGGVTVRLEEDWGAERLGPRGVG